MRRCLVSSHSQTLEAVEGESIEADVDLTMVVMRVIIMKEDEVDEVDVVDDTMMEIDMRVLRVMKISKIMNMVVDVVVTIETENLKRAYKISILTLTLKLLWTV